MIIHTQSFPRAAIIGNPSDGYHGQTIAFVFSNFNARVTLWESPELEIIPAAIDMNVFANIDQVALHVNYSGYYGGLRLIKAMIKTFYDYCVKERIELEDKNFTLRYATDIPQRLGLAGSSAIITAGMKALMKFYEVKIPPHILANLLLSVEIKELGIGAGLQDRVAQAYEHPVFMDFEKGFMDKNGYGQYSLLDAKKLPKFYIAYQRSVSEGSEVTHNNLRARFEMGDEKVVNAMNEWASLSTRMKDAIENGDLDDIPELMNRNYDLRHEVMSIKHEYAQMVNIARSAGASAKFTGSGGALIGTYLNETMYQVLKIRFKKFGIEIIKPKIVTQNSQEND